jgi:hypothetical protein
MGTTTNYSWPIPEDTDLVKDGAEAIRDLGNAIDTTVDGLPGAGLVHIKTVTDTGVASISLGSDADPLFSSEYDNYKVIISGSNSSSANPAFRLRANTTDASAANYVNQNTQSTGSTVDAAVATTASFSLTAGSGTGLKTAALEIVSPFLSSKTSFLVHSMNETGPHNVTRSGYHSLTNSYNGLTLLIASGTLTNATVSVYGYRK